jgi:DNA polymerase I-like protein with 3'-5' exonuclease and polymerase domains
LVLEIHDSIIAEVPDNELDEYVGMTNEIMTETVRLHMPWVFMPLKTECEHSPLSWADKEKYKGSEK